MTLDSGSDFLAKAPFAFAIHKLVRNSDSPEANFHFETIHNNPGYIHLLGLSDTDKIEKNSLFRLESVFSDKTGWLEIFYRTAYEGAIYDQEYFSTEIDCWLHIQVYQMETGCFATVITPLNTFGSKAMETAQLFQINPDMVCVIDHNGHFLKVNPAFAAVLGGNAPELRGRTIFDFIHQEDLKATMSAMDNLLDRQQIRRFVNRYLSAAGKLYFLEWNAIADDKYVYAIARDITERFEQQAQLEQLTVEKDIIFNGAHTAMYLVEAGADGKMRYLRDNLANQKLLAPICKNVTGKTPVEVFGSVLGSSIERYFNQCLQEVKPIEYTFDLEIDDSTLHLRSHLSPIFYDQERVFIVGSFVDLTNEKKTQQRISYLSFHDQLTGLYNRHFYEEEVVRLDVRRNLPLAVVQADVNGLKLANDAFGHAVGDRLLKEAASVLRDSCRADDIVARLGGDEFILLLPKTDIEGVKVIVSRMQERIDRTQIESIPLSISLGWSVKEDPRENFADVMKRAEDYMYRRKLTESPAMRSRTINTVMTALHEKYPIERAHSETVGRLAALLGRACALPVSEIDDLKTLAHFHDIGKTDISEAILSKKQELTEDEWGLIHKHPETGYRLLSTVNELADIADHVLSHHERWDGTGYPRHLKATEIPLPSRIIALTEAYEAMTTDRPYRQACSPEEALKEINSQAGLQFDPELVKLFNDLVISGIGKDETVVNTVSR